MKRNLIKMMMGLVLGVVVCLAGCGGGGGGEGQSTPTITTPEPVKKTSIIDGSWRIVTDGSWGYRSGQPAPTVSYPIDPFYLAIFNFVKFDNGIISGVTSTGTTWHKDGPFTVTDGVLEYTFTNSQIFTEQYFLNPLTGKYELGYKETKTTINEHVIVNVTVSGNSMIWKDNGGNIVATFTKA